ncbi:MAG: SEC-C domain-containing protein [Epulopiscium sp.]|nr:SEC-C domain-containing protein [Candidatus Epulonipiscium sp.]
MTLYEQWDKYAQNTKSQEQYTEMVEDYLMREKDVYQSILSNPEEIVEGTISELAKKHRMTDVEFVGFVDGINDSLKDKYDLQSLTEDSQVSFEIDYKELYKNMLDAKAKWLFELEEWEDILTIEERKEIRKEYNKSKTIVKDKKIGRNEPCICGSGKKYKKCCGR